MSAALASPQEKTHFYILQGLLLMGYFFHQLEDWGNKPLCFLAILGVIGFTYFEKWAQAFFSTVVAIGIGAYLYAFPNLANHSNFTLFLFLALVPDQIKLLRNTPVDFKNTLYTFRWMIFVLYFFTLFHKLNWDFMDPQSSCANDKLVDYFEMIPVQWLGVRYWFYRSAPTLGLLVEGIIPLFLIFGATRKWAIVFIVILHFTLAPMGFTDFSSLAMGMAWSFIDPRQINIANIKRHFKQLVSVCLIFEMTMAPWRFFAAPEQKFEILEGFLFALTYLPFIYLYHFKNVSKAPLRLPSQLWQKTMVAFLIFFGLNSYLGLRTAGNFSMFSNLRTEGPDSNHILMGSNPIKIFSLQEDLVEVLYVSPRVAGFYKRMPRKGQLIPRIEFERILEQIRLRPYYDIDMKIKYKDEVKETKRAGFDESFRLPVPWIYKKLLKFRYVQPHKPQYCHW